MSVLPPSTLRNHNLLLSMLSEGEYDAISPRLHVVSLARKDTLHVRNEAYKHVYFPTTAVISILAFMSSGAAVEVGTVGKEGFVGIEVLAGGLQATETSVCQVAGEALRMTTNDFSEAISGDAPLRRVLQRYMLAYLSLISQSVACNRLHTIEERFARWILMTHDRVDGDQFDLTQEFIADMLGVHRPSVSLVANAFQQAGFIRYSRGKMSILNRTGLEDTACECYEVVRSRFVQMLGFQQS